MKKKYINLTRTKMNLQIKRYETMPVSAGIGLYEEKIANSFPSIFKLVEEEIVVNDIIKEENVVNDIIKEEIVVNDIIKEENVVNNIDYSALSYQELRTLIEDDDIEIEGRKTSKKMIDALNDCK